MRRSTADRAELRSWLRDALRPGDHVVWSQGAATPVPVVAELAAVRDAWRGGRALLGVGVVDLPGELADAVELVGLGALGTHRRLADAGHLAVLPDHFSQVPSLLRRGHLRADVAVVQVSPPDATGRHSLGLDASYVGAAIEHARLVVAEVDTRVPWTAGHDPVPGDRLDLVLCTDRPLPELPAASVTDVARRIAAHAAAYVEDGATLQVGIGAVPGAVLDALRDRRDLGLHTGLLDDRQHALVTTGVVTGARRDDRPGRVVAATIAGTAALYDELARDDLDVVDAEVSHGLASLARVPRLTAIDAALEVDLTGNLNAEVAGDRYVGGVGGIGDFLRGALVSPGGRSLVVLPSTDRHGRSRIVPAGACRAVTVPRSDVDVVVTEHGAAELRGCPLEERARRLITIADPSHRDALTASVGSR